jgi:hypothetical protein
VDATRFLRFPVCGASLIATRTRTARCRLSKFACQIAQSKRSSLPLTTTNAPHETRHNNIHNTHNNNDHGNDPHHHLQLLHQTQQAAGKAASHGTLTVYSTRPSQAHKCYMALALMLMHRYSILHICHRQILKHCSNLLQWINKTKQAVCCLAMAGPAWPWLATHFYTTCTLHLAPCTLHLAPCTFQFLTFQFSPCTLHRLSTFHLYTCTLLPRLACRAQLRHCGRYLHHCDPA